MLNDQSTEITFQKTKSITNYNQVYNTRINIWEYKTEDSKKWEHSKSTICERRVHQPLELSHCLACNNCSMRRIIVYQMLGIMYNVIQLKNQGQLFAATFGLQIKKMNIRNNIWELCARNIISEWNKTNLFMVSCNMVLQFVVMSISLSTLWVWTDMVIFLWVCFHVRPQVEIQRKRLQFHNHNWEKMDYITHKCSHIRCIKIIS